MSKAITTVIINGKETRVTPWSGMRTDYWGNNRACDCEDLMRVLDTPCVCRGRAWCPTYGGPKCVGGHN